MPESDELQDQLRKTEVRLLQVDFPKYLSLKIFQGCGRREN